ncbi:MAG: hypothetical protein GF344_08585 [Chitinivibrionales bacterium]|nr:hypothetical protein [Chitinivibrionales bacterium]MBD3356934.1 hypothetical protein [Chitinivibrionales bacterium]
MGRRSSFAVIYGAALVLTFVVAGESAIASITTPTSSSSLRVGDTMRIEWKANATMIGEGARVKISFNGGIDWYQISPGEMLPSSVREMEWVIPESLQVYNEDERQLIQLPTISDEVLVKVSEGSRAGTSTAPFSILPAAGSSTVETTKARSKDLLSITKSTAGNYMVMVPVAGEHTLTLVDGRGRQIRSRRAMGPAAYTLPVDNLAPGAYLMRVTTPKGSAVRQINVR